METIIEYRDDRAPANDYPQRIVSPTAPSACCAEHMEPIGQHGFDANWRFFYKRCRICGYAVRCFYAPSLSAVFEAAREVRITLAEMNLGTGKRKRRTQAEIAAEIAAAGGQLHGTKGARRPLIPVRHRQPAASAGKVLRQLGWTGPWTKTRRGCCSRNRGDRALPAVRRPALHDPEDPADLGIGRLGHHVRHQPIKGGDPAPGLGGESGHPPAAAGLIPPCRQLTGRGLDLHDDLCGGTPGRGRSSRPGSRSSEKQLRRRLTTSRRDQRL
jgi:hypothetical protein